MSLKESTSKKNYSNTHPKNKNTRVAKGPVIYPYSEEGDTTLADEFGTTIDHAYEDEFMKPQAKKKKLKNKKKKRA